MTSRIVGRCESRERFWDLGRLWTNFLLGTNTGGTIQRMMGGLVYDGALDLRGTVVLGVAELMLMRRTPIRLGEPAKKRVDDWMGKLKVPGVSTKVPHLNRLIAVESCIEPSVQEAVWRGWYATRVPVRIGASRNEDIDDWIVSLPFGVECIGMPKLSPIRTFDVHIEQWKGSLVQELWKE